MSDKNYRMSNELKYMLLGIKDKELRRATKKVMIQAEVEYEANKKRAGKQLPKDED